jgi:hypothetical protein
MDDNAVVSPKRLVRFSMVSEIMRAGRVLTSGSTVSEEISRRAYAREAKRKGK